MRNLILSAAVAMALTGCSTTTTGSDDGGAAAAAQLATQAISAAVADTNRPAGDTARDAARKPAEMLAFAGVKPGDKVVDFLPGGGYFTRLFAKAVGPAGHVYAVAPPSQTPGTPVAVEALAADAAYGNITVVPLTGPLSVPEAVDVIWTAQNYHDLHLARLKVDVPAMNKSLFDALKPGGLLVIVDHAALAGTGLDVPDKLHRIDEEIVKREVTAAGFVLESSSDLLRNSADTRSVMVFDPAIKGLTDQFVLRFRKPQ